VDQVWHLHLVYTRSYWQDFCPNVLRRELHHGPTLGGAEEQTKFTNWYARTKETYAARFGEKPPRDIWPDSRTRFARVNFRRVDMDANWILPRPVRRGP
jgi:hypothetical protein